MRENPDAVVIGVHDEAPEENLRDESNQVFDFEVMGEDGLATYSVDNLGGGDYTMYAEDGTSIEFEHHGDPEDHYGIQDKAAAALKARGIIDDDTWIS
jgi:hypothetical protein